MWITNQYEFLKAEIIRQGVMAIQSGDNPRIVEQMLVSMLPDNVRKMFYEKKKQK
jgi:flagellar motor component MotA